MPLLRNRGDGTFEDVTLATGAGDPISSLVAACGDYDNDGLLDLFVCGEYLAARRQQCDSRGRPAQPLPPLPQ